jgi:multicomponent Na+:H+ antiporter subunit B
MRVFPILRVVTKILLPYIILFAFYVQFHGDFGPGGGFQAGVIFAAGIILYALVFGLSAVRNVLSPVVVESLVALGVLVYAGTGVVTLLLGGDFLDYDVLEHHLLPGFLPHGQHLGIFIVEAGVGITVAGVMIAIFYAFAGRERTTS